MIALSSLLPKDELLQSQIYSIHKRKIVAREHLKSYKHAYKFVQLAALESISKAATKVETTARLVDKFDGEKRTKAEEKLTIYQNLLFIAEYAAFEDISKCKAELKNLAKEVKRLAAKELHLRLKLDKRL